MTTDAVITLQPVAELRAEKLSQAQQQTIVITQGTVKLKITIQIPKDQI